MKSKIDIINQFDSCVKNALAKELKYRMRSMKTHQKHFKSISELSYSEEAQLVSTDKYTSEEFKEKLTTRLFEAVVHDELLYEALLSIKPKTREIILLKYWGELTDHEVGKVMNMNRDTVTHAKIKALLELKKFIEELSDNET